MAAYCVVGKFGGCLGQSWSTVIVSGHEPRLVGGCAEWSRMLVQVWGLKCVVPAAATLGSRWVEADRQVQTRLGHCFGHYWNGELEKLPFFFKQPRALLGKALPGYCVQQRSGGWLLSVHVGWGEGARSSHLVWGTHLCSLGLSLHCRCHQNRELETEETHCSPPDAGQTVPYSHLVLEQVCFVLFCFDSLGAIDFWARIFFFVSAVLGIIGCLAGSLANLILIHTPVESFTSLKMCHSVSPYSCGLF